MPRKRRTFTAEYKRAILARIEAAGPDRRGRVRELLRAEGLRSSHLAQWRRQSERGVLEGARRGRPPKGKDTLAREVRRLRRQLGLMRERAIRAEQLIVLQLKYVRGAALRFARKDRGLLSALLAELRSDVTVSSACEALALERRDFYRTIRPLGAAAPGRPTGR